MNRKSYFRMKVVNTIMGFFFKGLLVVVPIWVSGYVIYWIITTLNNAFSFVVGPGYGLLIVLAAITLIGMLVNYMVTDPISRFFNSFLDRMPVIKMMYTTIRDFLEAFVGEQKKFTEPVFVEMSETGIKKVGFITQKDLTALGLPGYVGVYFPHSYNFSGNYFLVPAEKVTPMHSNAGEIMKYVVSGGVSKLV
ncbi:MAG TPA: DUF502 domain-containing protein [Anseongella sp.]